MFLTPVAIALAAFSVYLFATSLWALNGIAALEKSAALLTLSVFAVAGAGLIAGARADDARQAAGRIMAGLLAGLVFLAVEYALGLPVTEFLARNSDAIADSFAKHDRIEAGRIEIATLVLNKNITILALFFVPMLLLTSAFGERSRTFLRAAIFALVAICVWLTESGTAIAAIVAGAGLLLLGMVSLRAVRWLIVTAWVIAVVFAVPLGALPAKLGATEWPFLPRSSVQARFYIWSYTTQKVWERPLTGIGVRATRELQPDVPPGVANSDAFRYRPRPGRHAHNGFLQVWLELGAIGAALLLTLGLAALRAIASLPPLLERYGHALYASICIVAAFGYGIWQTWLLAGFACAVLLYLLGARLVRQEPGAA